MMPLNPNRMVGGNSPEAPRGGFGTKNGSDVPDVGKNEPAIEGISIIRLANSHKIDHMMTKFPERNNR